MLVPVQLVEGPERDDVVEGEEDQEAAEVDQCAPGLGDAHHLDVDPGGGAREIALDHGLLVIGSGRGGVLIGWGILVCYHV